MTDIVIDMEVKRLHVLNGTGWRWNPASRIGQLIVHYQDGDSVAIPIRYERQVLDWWNEPSTDPEAPLIAWEGSIGNRLPQEQGSRYFMGARTGETGTR